MNYEGKKEVDNKERLLVSIIVPIYNVEKYLDECVQSLVSQTYHELEILLIEDGAKDKSGELADCWGQRDKRIRVIHQANKGLSGARNTGLREAKGEYIFFVDSDDYVAENYVEEMVATMIKEESDIAMCGFFDVWKDGIGKSNRWQEKQFDMDVELYSEMFYQNPLLFIAVWNKGYRRSLFEGVLFDDGKVNEDARLVLKLWPKIKKVTYIPQELYFYRRRKSGIMKGTDKDKLLWSELEWLEMHLNFHRRGKNKHLYVLALKMKFYQVFWYYSCLKRETRKTMRCKLRHVARELLKYKELRLRAKLKLIFCCCFPRLYTLYLERRMKHEQHEFFD